MYYIKVSYCKTVYLDWDYYNLPFYKHTHYTKASKLHYYTDASITFLCTIEGLIAWKGGPTYCQIPRPS